MTRSLRGQGATRHYGARLSGKTPSRKATRSDFSADMANMRKKSLTVILVSPMLAVVGRSWLSWIEQQATNLWVGSSNLSGRTTSISGRLTAMASLFSCPSQKRLKKRLTFWQRTTSVLSHRALVAQLDRATGYEPVGREFESLRAHHKKIKAYEQS